MHETKTCPRCGNLFECKRGNIKECQCFGIRLTTEQRDFLAQHFDDCLCRNCLTQLENEFRAKGDLPLDVL